MSWIVVCYRNDERKAEEQRIELGMTVKGYNAFRKKQIATRDALEIATKNLKEARASLKAAIKFHASVTKSYNESCILPEKYQ
jgi:hypothetical protein